MAPLLICDNRAEVERERFVPGTPEFRRASLALFIASFLTFANIYITQPLLPLLVDEFDITPAVSSLTVSLTIFALGFALLIFGPVSDAVGRRPVMFWTMALAVLPALLAPLVSSINQLLLIRIAQGLLLAGLPSVAMAYLGEEFSPRALGLAVGLYISGNSIGGMSGRVISGMVAEAYSWRASFLVMGIIGLVGVILFYLLLPPSAHFKPAPAGLRKGLQDIGEHLRNGSLLKAYSIAFVIMFSFVGIFNYITFRLSGPPYNLSPAAVGWLFLTYSAGTISSTVSGRFIDLAGNRVAVILGVLIALGGVLITLLPALWAIVLGLLFFCFGFFAVHAAASAWANRQARRARASAMGLYLLFYYVGGSFGSTGLGFLWHARGWPGVTAGIIFMLALGLLLGLTLRDKD
ncbi:MFS transporter [Desulfoscipio geothermicus]|uniref:MFS transporter, YNFM family, putative membrane transport protein n=1 Tax=Desulfoscipio geothermicus DSM 3669 TaxID=1121426 RepID=A0A1I6EA03_9FIRM|nr:MFS transporter [Desulfoscipio geothermicus]SFR14559.1 MFS transporter, YNFM family, putative membrane transport protein [Desulfoscipio geothermicus DSM 3669]